MRLFTHQPDIFGEWLDPINNQRYNIFDYNDFESGHRTETFNSNAHGARAIRANHWTEAESIVAYAALLGFVRVGPIATAADIEYDPNLDPSELDSTNVQDAIDELHRIHEVHEMEWDTSTWTALPAYTGLPAFRKQMWDGQMFYYVRTQDYSAGISDGILVELDAGIGEVDGVPDAPILDPAGPVLRTFTKSQVDGIVTVA